MHVDTMAVSFVWWINFQRNGPENAVQFALTQRRARPAYSIEPPALLTTTPLSTPFIIPFSLSPTRYMLRNFSLAYPKTT